MKKQNINLYLASPRGFCAGVDRAVKIVEETIKKFGSPVYVRHEIVHNKDVVNSLAKIGAVFVEEVNEAPVDRPIIFSAHGVAKSVINEANQRKMISIDATCPLVTKVHNETVRHYNLGRHILLVGHKNHPEVTGTILAPFFFMASTLGLCLFISFAPINILHLSPNFLAAIESIFPAYPAPVSPTINFLPALLAIKQ